MTILEKEIRKKIAVLPNPYLQEVLDFINFLDLKYQNSTDTEYLSKLSGFKESIIDGRKEKKDECKSLKDIGWE